ncbi:MAG: flavin reductase family protein [Deltaproteobacteria bacterium]|nr:flavin reductase family protein [Deltaproteobacteria bacterium]
MKKSVGAKTIVHPTPAFVVATYDKAGRANAMTAAWGGICCSVPPCVAVALRKATYTFGNILERKAFTVNIASERHVAAVDYFGIVSGKTEDKFAATGLTPVKSDLVDAPLIDEFPFVLECRLLQSLEIGLHTQFIGEILDIKAEPSVLGEGGIPDIEKVKPILFAPEDRYYWGVGAKLGKAFSLGLTYRK